MRVSVDLDGTLTLGGHSLIHYLEMKPNQDAIKKINSLAAQGDEVFIYTARPHLEHEHIETWLENNGVLYDHIECGKLKADLYIDNNSKRIEEL